MKKNVAIVLTLIMVSNAVGPVGKLHATTIEDGLVAHWTFDERSGTMARDSSGHNNTGTLKNGPVWIQGKVGAGALSFDGVNDCVNKSPTNGVVGFPRTLAQFVRPHNPKNFSDSMNVAQQNKDRSGFRWINGQLIYDVNNKVSVNALGTTLNDGNWHHIAAVSTSSTDHRLFVDGIQVGASTTLAADMNSDSFSAGCRYWQGLLEGFWAGDIDDVRIYNRALSATEIQSLQNHTDDSAISSILTSDIYSGTVMVSWVSRDLSDSQVEYGLTTSYGQQTTLDSTFVTFHTQTLSGLMAETPYHFRVKSKDGAGHVSISDDQVVTTAALSPGGGNLCVSAPAGHTFYVSPGGSPSGNGSCGNPWDLETALNQPTSVKAGDTIYMRDGVYHGLYTSVLAGSPGLPITVRSYPGEWAKIDTYVTGRLASAITATQNTIPLVDASYFPSVYRENEGSLFIGVIDPTSPTGYQGVEITRIESKNGNALKVLRIPWTNTTPTAYPAGTPVYTTGAGFSAMGSDAIYRDFEVYNSNPNRSFAYYVSSEQASWIGSRDGGVGFDAPRNKFINLVTHDTDGGGSHPRALDSEMYGLIIYNIGYVDVGRGHGHGLYIQHNDMQHPQKYTDIISFNNSASGMKAFGEQGYARGVEFRGIMSFNNGSPSTFDGNPAHNESNVRMNNLLVGTAVNPPAGIVIKDSYLYHIRNAFVTNLWLGYIAAAGSGSITVEDNYVAGGLNLVGLNGWNPLTFTGNTLVGGEQTDFLIGALPDTVHDWILDKNTYHGRGAPHDYVFSLRSADHVGNVKFDGWREWTGFDANSTYSSIFPTGSKVFVRPNQYEVGRANIAIYNWGLASSVAADLSGIGLVDGDPYEIRNVQNYFGSPVLTATYNSASPTVNIPMTDLTVTPLIGQSFVPASTLPEFGVFVVRKVGGGEDRQPTFYGVTVTKSGNGFGTVFGGAINCGVVCTSSLNSGTTLSLSVAPATGSTFTGWSGACSGNGSCVVTIDGAKTVTATFTKPFDSSEPPSIPIIKTTVFNPTKGETLLIGDSLESPPGEINIYNHQGILVRTYRDATSTTTWDGRNQKEDIVAAGIYIVKFPSGQRKVVVIK